MYESDAAGILNRDLLDDVGYGIYVRCVDMVEVATAIRGDVACRACDTRMARRGWRQIRGERHDPKDEVLTCPSCDWSVTWGDYYRSCTGKRMLPGSATEVIEGFAARWPKAVGPAQKMRLIDWMIHEFHVNQRIDGRPVGENVINGSKAQVIALIVGLAYGSASVSDPDIRTCWEARLDGPVRRFRQAHSWSKTQAVARKLGIPVSGQTQDQLRVVEEILRWDPNLLSEVTE